MENNTLHAELAQLGASAFFAFRLVGANGYFLVLRVHHKTRDRVVISTHILAPTRLAARICRRGTIDLPTGSEIIEPGGMEVVNTVSDRRFSVNWQGK